MNRAARITAIFVAVGAVIGALWLLQGEPPDGPVPVAWDDEPCAECHMHVGEPASAAQLQTVEGDVLNFDDPGCLLRYVASHEVHAHATYFHDSRSNRWLDARHAAFVRGARTPMGYGLAAVPRGTAGALSVRQAADLVASHGTEASR